MSKIVGVFYYAGHYAGDGNALHDNGYSYSIGRIIDSIKAISFSSKWYFS